MNIQFDAHLLLSAQKTGIGWTALNLLKSLAKLNNDHSYTLNYFAIFNAHEKRQYISELINMGFKVNECRYFTNRAYKLMYSFVPLPYKLFFGNNADISHFMNYHVPPGVSGKIITMVYDMVYKAFPETMNKKTLTMLCLNMKRSCSRADAIITISSFSKNEIIKYLDVPPEKIYVMPCGVDSTIFHAQYDAEQVSKVKDIYGISDDYYLYLGTLEPRKNIVRLIEAYSLLRSRNSCVPKLVIAGGKGWLYDDIFAKVNQLGLQDDVLFTGYVDTSHVPLLFKGAYAFVFPSIYEGFGLPPLEAMACGTPVITSNVASLPEVVGDAALLVDPYSVDSIADGMEKIISDSQLRFHLSKRGLKRASEFSWDNSARIVLDIYSKLS